MGVDTKAILFGNPNAEQIAQAITATFGLDAVYRLAFSNDPSYVIMNFPDPNHQKGDDVRRLNIHLGCTDYSDVHDGSTTVCSLGCWGSSIQIMDALARKFGGFVYDSDSVGHWRAVAPMEAGHDASVAPSPIDELNLVLSKAIAPAAAIEIRDLAKDPQQFSALMAALDTYRSKTAV